MLELGVIPIKDTTSIVEARNKIHILAQNLKFDKTTSTRLAVITSNLSRLFLQKGGDPGIMVGFKKRDGVYGLTLDFFGRTEELLPGNVEFIFDHISISRGKDGFKKIKGYKQIPDPGFSPTEEFISSEREMLIRLSKAEMFSELKRKNEELDKATRLKSEFLANMSHELRTPMNSIIGFTSRVIKKSGHLLPGKQLNNLNIVKKNAYHLLNLINSLLDLSKIEAGKLEVSVDSFDLSDLVSEVLTLTRALIDEKNLEVRIELPEKKITLVSDRMKLKQILINLVSNSVKFSEKGGFTVSASMVERELAAKDVFFKPDMDYVSISVIDTGIGMNNEEMQYIFKAFQQVDGTSTREVGGTGLGLTITKKFVELLEGRIEVKSRKAKGTTFTITIPRKVSSEGVLVEKEVQRTLGDHASVKPSKTVLCIDDDPLMLDLLKEYLNDNGYNMIFALNGDEGIKKAREMKPFAITLDVSMPGKDGWDVLTELKSYEDTKNIPVIMLTMMDNINLARSLGAVDFLQKPVDPEVLIKSINSLVQKDSKSIMVVDDDPEVRDMIKETLEDEDITVNLAENGLKGLAAMEKHSPDLILLDLMMPEMDGFKMINQLKKHKTWSKIPVIVITSKILTREEKSFLNKSVYSIIQKDQKDKDTLLKKIGKKLTLFERHTL